MDKKERDLAVVALMADHVHESAELASELYEEDRLYRREDLYQVLDAKRLESAQIIASLFLKAAQLRDGQHLRALRDALFASWGGRRKRWQLARPAAALGASGAEFFRRQQRMTELVGFLALEIMAVAFILALSKGDGGDDGGGTAAYLVETLPELRPPCPIAQYEGDVDQEDEYEGQR